MTATTAFFLRPTTNRFVACSMSIAGCSPGGGGPTLRTGSRTGVVLAVVFGSSMTSIIVVSYSVLSLLSPEMERAAGPMLSVRGSRMPVGIKKPWT